MLCRLVSAAEVAKELTVSFIRAEVCENRKETFLWLQTYICTILKFKLHEVLIFSADNRTDGRLRNEALLMYACGVFVPRWSMQQFSAIVIQSIDKHILLRPRLMWTHGISAVMYW
jgi:hypothetical protein